MKIDAVIVNGNRVTFQCDGKTIAEFKDVPPKNLALVKSVLKELKQKRGVYDSPN